MTSKLLDDLTSTFHWSLTSWHCPTSYRVPWGWLLLWVTSCVLASAHPFPFTWQRIFPILHLDNFAYSLIEQILIEHLLCVRHCARGAGVQGWTLLLWRFSSVQRWKDRQYLSTQMNEPDHFRQWKCSKRNKYGTTMACGWGSCFQ